MSNQKEWIDISKIDWVIVPSLGVIALFIYFVASHITLLG
jgi:hypothetical protein